MSPKKTFITVIALLILLAVLYLLFWQIILENIRPRSEPAALDLPAAHSSTTAPPPSVEAPETEAVPPDISSQFLLQVPFTPQAPTANWDEFHNEACEEASALMANAFFLGDTRSTLPAKEVEQEIEKLTTWEQEHLGYYLSIDAEETVQMIEAVYGLHAEVIRSFSEDTLKTALTENKLVLAPVNGRKLGNPYFQRPGPIYHMFVIKGYDRKGFIVNEPGTKRGQDYRYDYQTIKNALGDYKHGKKETDPENPVLIIVSQ